MEFLMGNPKNIIPTERFLEKIRGYADEGGEMRPKSGNRRQILHKFNRKIIRIEHRVR